MTLDGSEPFRAAETMDDSNGAQCDKVGKKGWLLGRYYDTGTEMALQADGLEERLVEGFSAGDIDHVLRDMLATSDE